MKGKRIILAITGSIAAYKCAFLTRLLVKAGAEVKVLMTPAATRFIAPLTLSTLSKHEVLTEVVSEAGWNNHVELGLWADAMVVAPLTANTLAKLANGLCDNIVSAVYLSARCPVFFAPAMDLDMWQHPATVANVERLVSYGNYLIPVGEGELASGLHGAGRMAEPEDIVEILSQHFTARRELAGKHVLITAGPTHEPLDPVRFIGNHSTGKMGVALAESLTAQGAAVTLVLGPTHISVPVGVEVVRVTTAQEMYEAATARFRECDAAIMAAAVADYRPAEVAAQKIKKTDDSDELRLTLVKNPDIAAALGQLKNDRQVLVGFALETHDEAANARRKLERKNLDFIVCNSLRDAGAGFGYDTNRVRILSRDNTERVYELKTKRAVADDIVAVLVEHLAARS